MLFLAVMAPTASQHLPLFFYKLILHLSGIKKNCGHFNLTNARYRFLFAISHVLSGIFHFMFSTIYAHACKYSKLITILVINDRSLSMNLFLIISACQI
jgi:hypothetical protein